MEPRAAEQFLKRRDSIQDNGTAAIITIASDRLLVDKGFAKVFVGK